MTGALPGPCDGGLAARARGNSRAGGGLTLLASILASSLSFVDGSVVNVALPAIGAGLEARGSGLQWIVNAYALLFGGLLWFGTVVFTEPSRQCWVQPLGALSCAPPEAAWRPLTMTLLAAPLGLLSVLGKALAQRFLPKH